MDELETNIKIEVGIVDTLNGFLDGKLSSEVPIDRAPSEPQPYIELELETEAKPESGPEVESLQPQPCIESEPESEKTERSKKDRILPYRKFPIVSDEDYSATDIAALQNEGKVAYSRHGDIGYESNPYICGPDTPVAAHYWWQGFSTERTRRRAMTVKQQQQQHQKQLQQQQLQSKYDDAYMWPSKPGSPSRVRKI